MDADEKYYECKRKLDEHALINRVFGNYRRLKRYYEAEKEREMER